MKTCPGCRSKKELVKAIKRTSSGMEFFYLLCKRHREYFIEWLVEDVLKLKVGTK